MAARLRSRNTEQRSFLQEAVFAVVIGQKVGKLLVHLLSLLEHRVLYLAQVFSLDHGA